MTAQTIEMNLDHFYSLSMGIGFQNNDMVYMTILYAQAILETGRFTSNVYKSANNMYGMRPASRRAQNRVGVLNTANGDFAKFQTLDESLRDRVNWDQYNNITRPQRLEDARDYMRSVMDKGYTHEASYVSTWMNILGALIESGDASLYGQDMVDMDDQDTWQLPIGEGSGGLGLMEGINKIKVRYGILGLILLAGVAYFFYKRFIKKR